MDVLLMNIAVVYLRSPAKLECRSGLNGPHHGRNGMGREANQFAAIMQKAGKSKLQKTKTLNFRMPFAPRALPAGLARPDDDRGVVFTSAKNNAWRASEDDAHARGRDVVDRLAGIERRGDLVRV
ncbi:MAG: hypothetical protein EPN70_00435 [Paraburkholderia sp.]|uniref:hypothetical protein n=1 Tax=Paraburkholderia sp. TaxID=1926495 RepID=UPI00122A8BA2|nr:hypothetical protein [Paraburkholderia sp.]TAM08353.1 MAG: hypothetical protein EPN70_00435 [Paraburkholderia sp.]TAM29931.1 MAG: hypothetical protein EPN59_10830 [Paraburkholderia sp.]